ncbi:Acyl-CoA N-acyltransferase [Cordyceps fumosorosea ARSEF 2679]|uniref:Acyl-CoA N-acyltransferase n=1 Tax=Cordyceps fumosorosea (strain ARSEF 2679) TaxID=1081104 RepID=A0A168B9I1_CORFA|nr:Acyl-CoA N-acyltransferase [Cordyceps fumosorosea ARSEF 2679]OAA69808.1 Acyl-CoA N-acyltransferase [Cordyceps fumosorosea ARSEF 2679]
MTTTTSKVEDAVAADVPTLGAMHINAFDDNFPVPLFVKPYAVAGWGKFVRRAADPAPASGSSGLQPRVGVIRDDSGNRNWSPQALGEREREREREDLVCRLTCALVGTAKAACLLWIARDREAVDGLYGAWRDAWGEPHEGMVPDRLDTFFGDMKAQHRTVMGRNPHMYLEIIMAHSTARGKGYGKALLLFANELADELGLPLYLDADEDVVGLYERVGYVRQPEEVRESKGLVPMVRAAHGG